MLDRSLSIRLDVEQLHAIEQITATIDRQRPPGWMPEPGKKNVRSASDTVRELIALGLLVHARDPEFLRDLLAENYADELQAVLASGYADPRCYKILKGLAEHAKPKPELDFG